MQVTKEQIQNLKVGDLFPNMFGKMKKVTSIYHKGYDINGKFFACFYQEFGVDSTMSNSVKEDEVVFIHIKSPCPGVRTLNN